MSARNRRKYVGPKKKKFLGGAAPEPPRGGLRPPAPPSYPPARPAQALRHYYSCKEYNTYPTITPTTTASPTTTTNPSSSKGLRTKYFCVICSEYGHYTHHYLALLHFWQTLAAVCQNFQNNPRPAMSSSNITDIHYVTTSVNEHMRFPFSLCNSLTHFTYQCPMILAYRQRQLALLHRPAEAIIDITSLLEDLHVISPEPEALPRPPWFLNDVSEDLPCNPPNSPAYSVKP
jgi:hypothetical protein